MIQEYVDYKKQLDIQLIKKLNFNVDDKQLDKIALERKIKINGITSNGLDIGTIMKCIVKVEIVKYKDDFYFRDLKTKKMYKVSDYIN